MTQRGRIIIAAAIALALGLVAFVVLRPDAEEQPIARLVGRTGQEIERDFADQQGSWKTAAVGAIFALGDGVRTGAGSTASLALADASQLSMDQHAMIRFLSDEDDDTLGIDVRSGNAKLSTGQNALTLRTQFGLARIDRNSQVTLSPSEDSLSLEVHLGSVQFTDENGQSRTLQQGEQVSVGIGMVVLAGAEQPESPPDADALTLTTESKSVSARGPGEGAFKKLSAGRHTLRIGTIVRIPRRGEASVERGAQRAEISGAGEFIVGAGDALIETKRGGISAEAEDEDVAISIPGGKVIVRASPGGSRATVTVDAKTGDLSVERGNVTALLMGETLELAAGEEYQWTHAEEQDEESESEFEPEADYFNVKAPRARSFVIHAPEVPVAVAFDAEGKCPGDTEVHLRRTKQRVRGDSQVNVLLGAGNQRYVIRCVREKGLSRPVLSGTVNVLRDAGTRKLPPKPPTSLVEADGRTYTIYYPNQLPDIEVRWPSPPVAKQFLLDVDGKTTTLQHPTHTFKSGSLRDGSHRLTFSSGKRRSRTATVVVRFDNSAPTASIIRPADRSFSAGDTVQVEGVAQSSWKVAIEGGEAKQYANDKFTGEITTSKERPDIVVRLTNRRKGTHFYLRRAAESQ